MESFGTLTSSCSSQLDRDDVTIRLSCLARIYIHARMQSSSSGSGIQGKGAIQARTLVLRRPRIFPHASYFLQIPKLKGFDIIITGGPTAQTGGFGSRPPKRLGPVVNALLLQHRSFRSTRFPCDDLSQGLQCLCTHSVSADALPGYY